MRANKNYTPKKIPINKKIKIYTHSVYRDLSRPMGALGEERAEEYQMRYECWEVTQNTHPHHSTHPYLPYNTASPTYCYYRPPHH